MKKEINLEEEEYLDTDDCLGYCTYENGTIAINFHGIWDGLLNDKRVKDKESCFIRRLSKVIQHEYLHSEIKDVIFTLYMDGEEKIIDDIVGRIY
jgi:hypothetical protein